MSISEIGEQVRSAINGVIISEFPKADEEVAVRLKLIKNEKQTDMINDLRIITNIGTSFKLEEIITISEEVPFASINRKNGFREVTISGDYFLNL